MQTSPYLKHPQRLPEILAAIQVMGAHHWDSLVVKDWQAMLGTPLSASNPKRLGEPNHENMWDAIFKEHPEFFQLRKKGKEEFWVLTWRLAYDPFYDPDEDKELTAEQAKASSKKLGRKPLKPEQITTLLTTAIELQVRAAAFEERRRWLITAAISFITTVIVVILGAILK